MTRSPAGPVWIRPDDPDEAFPEVSLALETPDGLLAAGGDLSPSRLLQAYRRGIFPWYSAGQPILWWSPDPRTVLFPGELHISRSLRRTLRRNRFQLSLDRDFAAVIEACAQPRKDGAGTWITPEMNRAYCRLHQLGHAHSIECRMDGVLVGGLYGVAIGRVFFGESMFSRVDDASKVAITVLLRQLTRWDFQLFDCQIGSRHLYKLNARAIPRSEFIALLKRWCPASMAAGSWHLDADLAADTGVLAQDD